MRFPFFVLLLLTACIQTDTDTSVNPIDMNGTIQISVEEAKFIYQKQIYYLNDERNVLSELVAQERAKNDAFLVKRNICLTGYIKTKAQNNNNGFGALGRYDKAIVIQKLC
ncbi:hypothetical protein [Neisseria chenwenguii]|uniref:Uncharacterized protein n=1 Tax=Neisseria chenwenguii TaxID=1853278 RepID=A0A220S4V4_9NEIS|nr:hypothetical protein [Neisseria chenwenguii]ASK28235.1 hypothetical protein BG910_11265 [Neisseria chenwenguii]ROV57359.1 hypothetical protein EGS38_01380 [Neisseria chenwenguii]